MINKVLKKQEKYIKREYVPLEEVLTDAGFEKEDELCPDCGMGELTIKTESREGGYSEIVGYCELCGYTETN